MSTKKIMSRILWIFLGLIGLIVIFVIFAMLFLKYYPSIGKLPSKADEKQYTANTSSYYDGQFHNENEVSTMTGGQGYKSDKRKPDSVIKAEKPAFQEHAKSGELTYTWFGHSSSMVQLGDQNIVIDPVLGMYSSPVTFTGVKRYSECPVTADSLPAIDVLFISHDHYDHLDYQTIKEIDAKTVHYIVPRGVDVILESFGVSSDKITPLYWWEETEIEGVTYTLTPSQHFTGRNPLKGNRTLWGGLYMQNEDHRVYYTGDTGYYDVFQRIYEKLGAVDLMLAEDGQYDDAWAGIHMMPEETVQAAVDMHAKWLVPVHWGTFVLANHAWNDPVIRAFDASKKQNQKMATPRIGQTVNYKSISDYTERWWE